MTSFEQPFSSDKRSTSFRRRFRKAFLLSSVIASGFAFNGVSYFGTGVFAQDPFDDLGSPPVPTAPSPKGVSSQGSGSPLDSNETNAVVRSLRANPPTTPKELGKAVELMTRIRRWDEASRWLDRIGKLPLDGPTSIDVLRAGSRAWSIIEANPRAFAPEQLALISKLRSLADQEVRSPSNLAKQVQRLTNANQAERLAGFDAIKAAGDSGIAAMLDAVMVRDGLVPTNSVIEAYSLLGPNATRAWQAAMSTPHADARERLIQLVNRAPQPAMGTELLNALYDPSISDASKSAIREELSTRGKPIPNPNQIYEYAANGLDQALDQYRKQNALNDIKVKTVWSLGEDGRSIRMVEGNGAEQALARASQLAIQTLRSSSSSDTISARAIAAYLEGLARTENRDLATSPVFQNLLPESIRDSHEFACLLWDAAIQEQLPGAQSFAVRNLARWQGALLPPAVRDRLAAAAKSGHAQVRYPASIALMNTLIDSRSKLPVAKFQEGQDKSDPQPIAGQDAGEQSGIEGKATPATATLVLPGNSFRDNGFHGSSRVEFVAQEMRQLMADPVLLVIGQSPSLRSHCRDLVNTMGFRFWEASTVDDVFAALRNAVPVEGIMIVDHVRDLDLGQLIQRIRANPSTSTVPIALLAENLSNGEHMVAGSDHGVIGGSVPPSLDGLGDILVRMNQVLPYPRTAPEDRIYWKENGVNFAKILRPQGDSSAESGIRIRLADTQEEQQNLLRIVSDAGATPKQREQASQIFVQSVRRFGLLISTDSANAQYDVYNTRGPTESVTRLVVGRVLDAIDEAYGRNSGDQKP